MSYNKTKTVRLVKEPSEFPKVKITDSKSAADYARRFFHEDIEIYESMFLIILNGGNLTEAYVKISQGGIRGTVVDVKLVAKYAIDCLASAIILVHNHPSGNLLPSKADINITKKVKSCMQLFDVSVLDHIILTVDGYYSFADNGDL